MSDDKPVLNSAFTDKLVSIILDNYEPAPNALEADEMKTSVDLIDEIEFFIETDKEILFNAMTNAGFKLHYTGEGYYWLLKLKLK